VLAALRDEKLGLIDNWLRHVQDVRSKHRGQLDELTTECALDAAAKGLAETGQPMRCTELIAAMAAKGYWTSPGGKTPASTLYAALLRELKTKKDQARFRKAERGKFGLA
jgi:hypothetical protein